MERVELERLVEETIKKEPINGQIRPEFIKALIGAESKWDYKYDDGTTRGLTRISKLALIEVNARYKLNYTWGDMLDIEKNILAGACYFAWLLNYWKTKTPYNPAYVLFAVISYHFGIGNVKDWIYHTKVENRFISGYLPQNTIEHAFDYIWWLTFYINRGGI
jgi:hypothetical protein